MKKHLMLDAYGALNSHLDDIRYINDVLNKIIFSLKLNPVTPPQLIPYYYGKVKEDIGVTAFMLLEGGHITIHTFPLRECYFVDLYVPTDFDDKEAYALLLKLLPFEKDMSYLEVVNRETLKLENIEYDPNADFGPHLMHQLTTVKAPTMEEFYNFLENFVTKINMEPISRAYVQKSTILRPKYLSAIIIIAQSHVALHYSYKTKTIFADIFSCAPFDFSHVKDHYSVLGDVIDERIIARGTKHIYKVKSKVKKDDLRASMRWQKAMKNQLIIEKRRKMRLFFYIFFLLTNMLIEDFFNLTISFVSIINMGECWFA